MIVPADCYRAISICMDPVAAHKFIVAALPELTDRYLFRIDPEQDRFVIWLQSIDEPKWSYEPPEGFSVMCKQVDVPKSGKFIFKLQTNPSVQTDGTRISVPLDKQLDWFKHKASESGFDIEQVTITRHWPVPVNSKDKNWIIMASLFNGSLRITDEERFGQALVSGIGRSKAYGFGLLSLAKVG
jgi:CRISPR system Cascade subunit CasE